MGLNYFSQETLNDKCSKSNMEQMKVETMELEHPSKQMMRVKRQSCLNPPQKEERRKE
jgi:hypothetical protein